MFTGFFSVNALKEQKDFTDEFEEGVSKKKTAEEKKLEDKFKPENFDLITWFMVSD